MKLILHILFLLFSINVFAQQSGNITGIVTDAATNEPLPGVNVIIRGTYHGAATDIKGVFKITGINQGKYNIDVSLIGFKTFQYTGIEIEPNKTKQLDVKLEETVLTLDQDVVVIGDKPLLDPEETQSKKTVSREEIDAFRIMMNRCQYRITIGHDRLENLLIVSHLLKARIKKVKKRLSLSLPLSSDLVSPAA